MTKTIFKTVSVFALAATVAFAQMPGVATASGIATGMADIAKWIGIILCIICGFGIAAGGPGAIAKVSGLVLGLIFAFFASPIINFLHTLG